MRGSNEPQRRKSDIAGASRVRFAGKSSVQMSSEQCGKRHIPISRRPAVLVPLDGSREAEHALPHALAIARRSGAALWLVHVYSTSVKSWLPYRRAINADRLRRQKQEYLQFVLNRLQPKVPVVAILIESADAVESLRDLATGAALVVMATHGRGLVERLLHDRITDKLISDLPCPLLMLRGCRSAVDLSRDPGPRHVLFPLDGTQVAETIFDSVALLGWLSQALFTLAHFKDNDAAQPLGRADQATVRRYLLDAAQRVKKLLPDGRTLVAISDEPLVTALQPLAQQREVDLIALTVRAKSSGMTALVKRSVRERGMCPEATPTLLFYRSARDTDAPDTNVNRSLWRVIYSFAAGILSSNGSCTIN